MPFDDTLCGNWGDAIEAFVDGDLPAGEAVRLQAHLEACPGCARELELARAIRDGLRALPELAPPPRALPRLPVRVGARDRLRRFPSPARIRPALARAALVTLAAAAALAVAVFLFRPAPAPVTTASRPSPAEVARAEREVRLAFAYVARESRAAGFQVRSDLARRLVQPTAASVLRSFASATKDVPAPRSDRGDS